MKKKSFHIGDIVSFGSLEENELEWKILTIDGEGAFITSCYGVSLHAFNDNPSPATWGICSLRPVPRCSRPTIMGIARKSVATVQEVNYREILRLQSLGTSQRGIPRRFKAPTILSLTLSRLQT